ncbi:protocadherin-1 isoform X2 [Brachionus plicatilis]|uniref:Protocadherin-1 isoform X2 n=1 Tax=Brachionus plicatilis TaxID=10195 RepID=A0A3M7QGB0_BRAPC|nr:protocadherin-1 isoform X2 [Brachionus plicatilis]
MIFLSFVFITLTSCMSANRMIQLSQANITEETVYSNYLLYKFESSHKLQLIPSSSHFEIRDSDLYVNGRFDREALIQSSKCESHCVLELKIASYDRQNNIAKIYNLPVLVQDINDNQPQFQQPSYLLNISENLSSKTIVSLEPPTDLDSPQHSIQKCEILAQTRLFSLNFGKENTNLFLVIERSLDRENTSKHFLNISCTDNLTSTHTQLVINVLDTNDNVPFFLRQLYNVTIKENVKNESIARVEADDLDDPTCPNGQLIYSIDHNTDVIKSLFFINKSTGLLGLLEELDYEQSKRHVVNVKVQDQGANPVPIFTNVFINVVDMNDNAPTALVSFSDKYAQKENRSNRTMWLLEEQSYASPADLCFLTLSDLDSAEVNGFNLFAELVSVSFFNTQSASIEQEDEPVFRLQSISQDYNNVHYSLQLLGQIDREHTAFFDVKIKLSDNKGIFSLKNQMSQSSFVNIRLMVIDINDNGPVFSKNMFYFEVGENVMELNFGSVEAYDLDLDQRLEYRILDSDTEVNPNFLFFIDPVNGSLSLRGPLDREKKEMHSFLVRVSDGTFSADIAVQVKVNDENDNEPFYREKSAVFQMDENLILNTLVGNVKAIDYDVQARTDYLIEPVEMNNFFMIEPHTGNLKTVNKIDAEKHANFSFRVLVKDADYPSYSDSLNVTVLVNDLNDNAPSLSVNNLRSTVNVCNCSGVKLADLEVTDLDRDAVNRHNSIKLGQIRRFSWQLVGEIIRNYKNQSKLVQDLSDTLVQIGAVKAKKVNLRSHFKLSKRSELSIVEPCGLNSGLYNLSILLNDSDTAQTHSVQVFLLNGTFDNLTRTHLDLLAHIVQQWWSLNHVFLSKRLTGNQGDSDDLESFIYSNLTNFNSKRLLGLTGIILFSKGSNLLIVTVLAFILIILILLIAILYKSLTYKPKSDRKMLNLKLDSTDSSSLASAKIKNMSLKCSNKSQDSFTVITALSEKTKAAQKEGSISEESYVRTLSSAKTDDNIQVNDMGYYGSSDYSDSFQQRSCKKLKNDSFTSSSVLSSPSTSSDASSTYRPAVTNLYPYKTTDSKQADVKLYLERFERIYNSNPIDNSNPIQNRITTYSYV